MDVKASGLRGLVFDKDGTLFDFNATWGAWARRVLEVETQDDPDRLVPLAEALGYDLEAERFHPHSLVIASTAEETARAAMPYLAETSVETLLGRWNRLAAEAPQVAAAPLVPLLQRFRQHGLALGVATNDAETPARSHLRAEGVEDMFDFIAGYDSGYGGKPAAGQLLGFCQAMNIAPEECAMVGDSTHDLHAGRAAGMVCVAVLTGVAETAELAPHADVVLPSIAALPEWLGLPVA